MSRILSQRPVATAFVAFCALCAVAALASSMSALAVALALAAALGSLYIAISTAAPPGAVTEQAPMASQVSDGADAATAAALLEGQPDPALLIDDASRIVVANALARALFQSQATGVRLSAVTRDPELLDAAQDAVGEDKRRGVVEYVTSGPAEQHFRVYVAPINFGARPAALMVFHDQTTMINTERMRVDFLANASHELRTPLASLTLLIETLSGHAKNDPEAQERFLKLMHAQAERMARLIDDLLSLSKIELNEHVPPADRVDLVALAKEIIDLATPAASERDVKLILNASAPQAWVTGDRSQLIQVAQNLVDNAIKYSPNGGEVEIEVAAGAAREDAMARAGRRWDEAARISLLSPPPAGDQSYAVLRVVDHGPGINRRHLPRLSERFFRVERDESSEYSGTGLGLAIVKHIVARHRGGFVVESEVGRGSAFAIVIEQPPAAGGAPVGAQPVSS